jgi:flagellar hook assembly protein FlgD
VAVVGSTLPSTAAPARAATAKLKAVIVVGPTHGQTASYLSRGEVIAQTAASYGMDVRRVFHPNATWSRVVSEAQGASIFVYLGHGNGWPSPYAPFQTNTKDGLGLNPVAGGSENTVKYYGEGPFAAEVRLATNAVVILNHLCYASGNSEPGHANPTLSVARERVDNYGAGFLRAGARAVFAYGIQQVSPIIRDLFTTNRTMDQIFMATGYYGTGEIRFDSVRTPGYKAHMDPSSPGVYYRSVIGNLSMTAGQFTGAATAPTDGAPASWVVPGAAQVDPTLAAQAVLSSAGGAATGELAAGTKVRLAEGPVSASGGSFLRITSPVAGWMNVASLNPADSTPPRINSLSPASGFLSPNGDTVKDTHAVSASFSETASWALRVRNSGGGLVSSWSGSGTTAAATWNGTSAGTPVADGAYRIEAVATDAWGNVSTTASVDVTVDTTPPVLSAVSALSVASTPRASSTDPVIFTPNGDGVSDTQSLAYTASQAGTLEVTVTNASAAKVRGFGVAGALSGRISWDGRTDAGAVAPDGRYSIAVRPRDAAGNPGAPRSVPVQLLTALRLHGATPDVFYPLDADTLAPRTVLGFTLSQPATVDWKVVNAAGATVVSAWDDRAQAAGSYTWKFDGRDLAGLQHSGTLFSVVSATTAAGTVTTRAEMTIAAFRITPSATTVARGGSVTFTLVSAEPLSKNPTFRITQPGLAPYIVSTTKTATNTYRVTVTLRTGGTVGTAELKAYGIDINGNAQGTYGSLSVS